MEKLIKIQQELKAPKNQYNSFAKFSYRSCEDILEAVKPLLNKYEVALIIKDDVVSLNNRYYIKATASLYNNDASLIMETSALAREEEDKKGMDASQLTGATSSYARKYALNGLFAIDDNKDADTQDNSKKTTTDQVKDAFPNSQTVPTEDDIKAYIQQKKYRNVNSVSMYKYFCGINWRNKNGTPIDWEACVDFFEIKNKQKKE